MALFTPMPADFPTEGSEAAAASEVPLGHTNFLTHPLRLYQPHVPLGHTYFLTHPLRLYQLHVPLGCPPDLLGNPAHSTPPRA